jgi:ABC-type uncharacterized transport system substrate-binding protein
MAMRRRDFIKVVGGSAITWPIAAHAQQTDGKRRVSILLPYTEADAEIQTWMASFVQALRELGWIDGSNVQIDMHRTTPDVGRVNQAAIEVADRKPDVILANGPLAVASLKQITNTIPIVFVGVGDPVGSGFVASLPQPGGNITGFTVGEFTMSGKLPEILKKIAPHVARVTVIYSPQQGVPQVGRLAAVQTAAAALSLQASAASAVSAEEIKRAIEKLDGELDRGGDCTPCSCHDYKPQPHHRAVGALSTAGSLRNSSFCQGWWIGRIWNRPRCAISPSSDLRRSHSQRRKARRPPNPGSDKVHAYR